MPEKTKSTIKRSTSFTKRKNKSKSSTRSKSGGSLKRTMNKKKKSSLRYKSFTKHSKSA